jgi:hypothetical protein
MDINMFEWGWSRMGWHEMAGMLWVLMACHCIPYKTKWIFMDASH